MNWRRPLRWIAIGLNGLAALWWFAYAVAWGPNDYIGGTVAPVPPIFAVTALIAAEAGAWFVKIIITGFGSFGGFSNTAHSGVAILLE